MTYKEKDTEASRKVFIIASGFSPRFNHIPSVRISKLAKFLSNYYKVFVVAGMPKNVEPNKNIDVGNASIIEISGHSLNKSNLSGKTQKKSRTSFLLAIKIFFGPLIMLFFSLTSGGGIFYKKDRFKYEINKIISTYGSNNVILLTSYNPWFVIRIGSYFKSKYKDIVWINDYRDLPFNNIVEPFTNFYLFKLVSKLYTRKSDFSTCVTKEIQNSFKNLISSPDKVLYYPNGYDLDDFPSSNIDYTDQSSLVDSKLRITYTGRFYQNGTRELTPFVAGLAESLKTSNLDVEFRYAGSQSEYVRKIFNDFGLSEYLTIYGVISREQSLKLQQSSDLLLLISYTGENDVLGDGIVTGKFFEYALNRKPVMVIGSSGWELKKLLLSDTKNTLIRHSDINKMSDYLTYLFNLKLSGSSMKVEYNDEDLNLYNHEKLAEKLASRLNST